MFNDTNVMLRYRAIIKIEDGVFIEDQNQRKKKLFSQTIPNKAAFFHLIRNFMLRYQGIIKIDGGDFSKKTNLKKGAYFRILYQIWLHPFIYR